MRQLKHAMNSVGDEVHRFALPEGATQTAIETRIGLWGLDFKLRCPVQRKTKTREAELPD